MVSGKGHRRHGLDPRFEHLHLGGVVVGCRFRIGGNGGFGRGAVLAVTHGWAPVGVRCDSEERAIVRGRKSRPRGVRLQTIRIRRDTSCTRHAALPCPGS